jgi:hypothetical protein
MYRLPRPPLSSHAIALALFFATAPACRSSEGSLEGACVHMSEEIARCFNMSNEPGNVFELQCRRNATLRGARVSAADINRAADEIASDCFLADIPLPPGELADGSACIEDVQCQGGQCRPSIVRDVAWPSWCGVCAGRLPEGATCTDADRCAHGLECGREGRCVKRVVAFAERGEACDASSDCKDRLRCSHQTCTEVAAGDECSGAFDCPPLLGCVGGRCAKVPELGEPCTPGSTTACASHLFCDDITKTCAPVRQIVAGGDCSAKDAECAIGSCRDGVCPIVLGEGDACAEGASGGASNGICEPGMTCVRGGCHFPSEAYCP